VKNPVSIFLLGIVIYGAVFPPQFQSSEPGYRTLYHTSFHYERRDSLGFLDGIHNGFSVLGIVTRSYCSYVWNEIIAENVEDISGAHLPLTALPFVILITLIIGIVWAVIVFCIHLIVGILLALELLFVATTPLYHLGFLIALGVTLIICSAAGDEQERDEQSKAQAPPA
jgi:hypothetical protein